MPRAPWVFLLTTYLRFWQYSSPALFLASRGAAWVFLPACPFSTCDTPGISRHPHPEAEPCIIVRVRVSLVFFLFLFAEFCPSRWRDNALAICRSARKRRETILAAAQPSQSFPGLKKIDRIMATLRGKQVTPTHTSITTPQNSAEARASIAVAPG